MRNLNKILEEPSKAEELNSIEVEKEIQTYLPVAYKFIEEHPKEWKLDHPDVDLEVTNHVLRVRVQDGTVGNYVDDVIALCRCQNADGGWGNARDDQESKVRSTAFCIQMLLRANRILHNSLIQETIIKGLNYLLSLQKEDGSWEDPTWHYLDAVSTSVGTLLFVVKEEFAEEAHHIALKKGMEFVISQRNTNGLWYYKPSGSPVTITAHLLQKCATYFGYSNRHDFIIRELIKLQHQEGHWDNGNTDHTCDAMRAMMLTSSLSKDPNIVHEVFQSACNAILWLAQVSREIGGGLGDKPGKPAHVERTCDGLDAMLKLRQFATDNTQMIKFWR